MGENFNQSLCNDINTNPITKIEIINLNLVS